MSRRTRSIISADNIAFDILNRAGYTIVKAKSWELDGPELLRRSEHSVVHIQSHPWNGTSECMS
jgi:hypothetical protein